MLRKGLSPNAVLACGALALATFAATRSPQFGQVWCVAAYLIGLFSCWRASALYPRNSPMRLGWLALGCNCFLSVFRHAALVFESTAATDYRIHMISQALQLPALLSVLLGLGAMWWGVYRLGLGFRVRWRECAGIVLAAAIITWTFRNNLSHAHSPYGLLTILQAISLGVLVAIAGVALLLNALSLQMGGGRLAVVMRCVAVYALTRCLLTLVQADRDNFSLLWWLTFYAVPWIFAFAAAYSCWLADGVRRSIRQQPGSRWLETESTHL